jgi:P-type conjugative transfer protein TrbJ
VRAVTRRRVLAAVGAGLLVGLGPASADADLWGADLGPLTTLVAQMITQIAQYATQIAQFASMISTMVAEVNLMKTELGALSSGDLMALLAFIQTARMSYAQLTNGVRSMAYTLSAIDSDFKRLFPPSTSGTTVAQHAQYYNQWNQEILASSQIAARQETVLSTLDAQASQADTVLQHSQAASGVVGQLQTVVEMLRLMQGQLLTINQSLASSGRMLADIAASTASQSQLALAKQQSSLTGYTSRGAPVVVPHRLP